MGVGEWTLGPTIGRGSSATVSIAVDRRTGEVLAVKSVGADRAAELRREQSILCGLSSPYVVRCLGNGVSAAEDRSGGYDMLMEYAPGGSLVDEIKRCGGRCEEDLIRSRARDILSGLAHVHAAGVAHCDVKGRNVLIGSDGRAMIADFGCARRTVGIAGERLMGGGTPMFMAPEAARGEEQGPAADIWALGCTVIEMATGAAPWQRFASPVAALHHVAFSGEVPEFPRWLSEEGKDFLGRCLLQDSGERWTAEQLLEHEFVAAAAVCSSNSVPGITQKEMFVSPKSVLDQALWDEDCTTADTTASPADRVRALAAGAAEWTWDASWITVVHSGTTGEDGVDDERAMWPEAEAESGTDSDSPVGSSSAGRVASAGSSSNSQLSHAAGDCYDERSSCNGEPSDDDSLTYTIRILLKSAIRNCDLFHVTGNDVEKILNWENSTRKQVEIQFKPAVSSQLTRKGYTEKETKGIERVGELHGSSFLLGVEEGATDAIEDIMSKLGMEGTPARNINNDRVSVFAHGN